MNPSLLGVLAAFALATGLWLAGRRPRPLLKSTDTRDVAALNRAQNTLVWEARNAPPAEVASEARAPDRAMAPSLAPPPSPAERQAWLRELRRQVRAGGPDRLEAMRRARAWGRRDVLPLLRQGLRDTDPAVVREAALAMEAFRGRPGALALPDPSGRPGGVGRWDPSGRGGQAIRVDQPGRPPQVAVGPRNVARTR
jgi:hypothetical protein